MAGIAFYGLIWHFMVFSRGHRSKFSWSCCALQQQHYYHYYLVFEIWLIFKKIIKTRSVVMTVLNLITTLVRSVTMTLLNLIIVWYMQIYLVRNFTIILFQKARQMKWHNHYCSTFVNLLNSKSFCNFLFKWRKSREIITVQFAFSRDFFWSNLQKFNNNAFTVWSCRPTNIFRLRDHSVIPHYNNPDQCTLVQKESISFRNYFDVFLIRKLLYYEPKHNSGIKSGFQNYRIFPAFIFR